MNKTLGSLGVVLAVSLFAPSCGIPSSLDGGVADGGGGGGRAGGGGGGAIGGGGAGGGSGPSGGGVAGGGGVASGGGVAGGGGGGAGGGTAGGWVRLDGGCYLLQPSFFTGDRFNDGFDATISAINELRFRFNSDFRSNFTLDAGAFGIDAGTYAFADVSTVPFTQDIFSFTADMETGPLGGPVPIHYRATMGQVVFEQLTTPPSSEAKGRFEGVVMREFLGEGEVIDGGRCAVLVDSAFNTIVPVGTPCSFATDCGDTFAKSCQPSTQTCQPRGCDGTQVMVGTQFCVHQTGSYALYDPCSPADSAGCRATETCARFPDPTVALGYCIGFGTRAEEQPCLDVQTDVNTGCTPGLTCGSAPGAMASLCLRPCNRFDAVPGCRSDQRCLGPYCTTGTALTDPAVLGQPCSPSEVVNFCGDDGLAFRGICTRRTRDGGLGAPTDPRICRPSCRTDAHCDAGQECLEGTCW